MTSPLTVYHYCLALSSHTIGKLDNQSMFCQKSVVKGTRIEPGFMIVDEMYVCLLLLIVIMTRKA